MEIKYKAGALYTNADALSRYPPRDTSSNSIRNNNEELYICYIFLAYNR